MKTSTRVFLIALLVIGGGFWFIGGALLIALTGGSEGHVSQKSDNARVVIGGIWLAGMAGVAAGLFRLLKPAPPVEKSSPVKSEPDKPNAT